MPKYIAFLLWLKRDKNALYLLRDVQFGFKFYFIFTALTC